MITIPTFLKTSGRAAVLALALGASTLAPMPAMAQSPNFTFEFGITGGGNAFSFGTDRRGHRMRRACLTNNEIRRGLRREGFDDIRFTDRRGQRVHVIADHRRSTYRMTVNRCSGKVSNIERLRRGHRDRGPSFGLQFNF